MLNRFGVGWSLACCAGLLLAGCNSTPQRVSRGPGGPPMASGPQGFRTEPLARTTTGNNPLGQTADQPPSRFPTAGNPVGGPTTAGTTFSTQSPLGAGPSASLSPGGLDAGLNPPPGSPVNTPASSISRLPYNPGSVVPTPGIPTTPGPYPSTAIPPGPNP